MFRSHPYAHNHRVIASLRNRSRNGEVVSVVRKISGFCVGAVINRPRAIADRPYRRQLTSRAIASLRNRSRNGEVVSVVRKISGFCVGAVINRPRAISDRPYKHQQTFRAITRMQIVVPPEFFCKNRSRTNNTKNLYKK